MSATVQMHSHRIEAPVMLDDQSIRERRAQIETEYGSEKKLKTKRDRIGLNADERVALLNLQSLDYLVGV